ncbi:selenium-dependent molybdenum cofactor biosynthesis protein YqeB [Miniphocaeibacter halophilus]|uniref:EF2563 family selenium-dependent molybdenum hydroxylase system protein n=1 Tax=Miniphocaeibacter halophilus TaxID=2931922 RepID=A0AC61MRM6_9FIRM|nr:selenium-dependent molybdenum cofactor biosynthesis protein YqeB [Miniphocaeibacter halophilus]QQK07963.1 EF2563 family selenium-dependent molybdenum hydroxylase system protein [Miniphocaeibacter halophilus]
MKNDIIVVRGGGDIATGVIQKLHRTGFRVLVLEIEKPTAIRRTVAVSSCIYTNEYTVEDIVAIKCENNSDVYAAWENNKVPVVVDPDGETIDRFKPKYIVDAIIAKKNINFNKFKAFGKIALGPGFEAGKDADIVIETNRGHDLGRLIFKGFATENTGSPGDIAGRTLERVIYSEFEGVINHIKNIGDLVTKGETIATIDGNEVKSNLTGVLRGLINNGFFVTKGLKIADVDPRKEEVDNCFTISDKARAIGGNTLEAILILENSGKDRG